MRTCGLWASSRAWRRVCCFSDPSKNPLGISDPRYWLAPGQAKRWLPDTNHSADGGRSNSIEGCDSRAHSRPCLGRRMALLYRPWAPLGGALCEVVGILASTHHDSPSADRLVVRVKGWRSSLGA